MCVSVAGSDESEPVFRELSDLIFDNFGAGQNYIAASSFSTADTNKSIS